ncbi:nuclear pore complex protein Nup160 homolog [Drosophila ficusphila]|uniref:nuclear pore complex protein Nup160 homolog n=1 Tax=Drosophila ficusphila TaxID=30025 RepID=UPI0007E797BD|nr:nuclear pore complex protein Nup160 homolog [Drosophila ficusphila]
MPTSKLHANMSYREVIPKNLSPAEWIEVKIHTGTQSTLQDLKTFETSGGYCYKSRKNVQTRNRFIYWRAYQDVLELSEVSLDISLQRNHLRMRFTDSAVLNVSLTEQAKAITLLVVTVSSVHRYVFPLKIVGQDESTASPEDLLSQSIFYDVNEKINDPSTFFVTDGFGTMPTVAVSYLSQNSQVAYFAVAYQSKLLLHIMNCVTGNTVTHEVKEAHLMPRFLSNLKGALTGRSETQEAATSMAFSEIEENIFILVLYRNNELRLWSVDSLQTVASINCLGESGHGGSGAQGPQNNQLRKISDQNFCLFISNDRRSEFICVSIVADSNENSGISLTQNSVPAPQMDLIDFDATSSHIWALWSNPAGDFNVSAIYFASNNAIKWVSAALEPPPDRYCLTMEQGVDPRESYCSYIFHPGRFDRNVIAKALYMFRRVNLQFDVKQLSMSVLKEQVCQAVEDEIQNELKDFVVTDDEYLEISMRLWDRFYSCCEQYHIKFSEPTGLAVLGGMDAVCLVRRQSFALLRPCEVLEHLLLIGEHNEEVATYVAPLFRNDPEMAKGFVDLMNVVTLLDKLISEELKIDFDKQLYQRESPITVIGKLVSRITVGDEDGPLLPSNSLKQIQQKLQEIPNLTPSLEMLLDVLCMIDPDAPPHDYSLSTRFLQPSGALLGSEYGLSILSETVKQMAMIRFSVCRNLLVLQYMVNGPDKMGTANVLTNINYLNSYYTLVWIAEMPISSNTPAGFEASIQRLSRAQLFSGYTRPYASHLRNNGNDQTTLLRLFLQSKGLFSALSMLLRSDSMQLESEQLNLRQTLLQLVGYINKMLWPDSPIYVFPEWLFGTCHHIIVQDYVRLLSSWCTVKVHARRFMLAVSLLDCGEAHKAVYLFHQTAPGVVEDDFLFEQVLKNTPLYSKLHESVSRGEAVSTEDAKLAMVHYYLKVIQLFEQHSALDYVIQLAHMAMNELQRDDPQLPMFQSIVFNNHLQLGHYEEAYYALVYNADTSRRKDCLRQLVITLFQNKSLPLLMRFPYIGLQDEFESIVESRARSMSIDQNDVYNFLYAFHTNKGNMRKAATVMYEQAMRFQVDSDAPNALEKRCSSLLICLNCLHLVDSRYRWIAKPTIGDERVASIDQDNDDGEPKSDENGQEVVVLELADIRRELVHAEALKELSHYRKDVAAYERSTPEELSYLLASCGLYTAALKLSRGYSFSVLPIFESLTTACVTATEDKGVDAWNWLQNNDMADLPHRSNAADMAWTLLQKLVLDNEAKDSTLIRKSVVQRLLALNAFLPQWLVDSYKLSDSRELLQLFVKRNRLLEAADLACEMIAGMLGAGSEYFDFKHSVNVTNPQLSFPINTIDLLLHALKINGQEDFEYEMAHVKLEEEVHRYIQTVKRITEDKMSLAILQSREERQQQLRY